ncbi:hypothetical protein K474DRAFT_1771285 [Panus rudis PR-1116 ss-1]|nr:hypothetical protein K474DRAFT_1771285 [Panus rudis PR-1116 ss-1]
MGQYWTLFNISHEQNMGSSGAKLGEMLFCGSYNKLVQYLARPTGFDRELTWISASHAGRVEHKKQLGSLSRFPDEILVLILKSFLGPQPDNQRRWGLYTLALTNTYLAEIAYEVVQRDFMEYVPQWVIHRLICVGDYSRADDLPPDVFHQPEVDAMKGYEELMDYLFARCPKDHSESDFGGWTMDGAPKALGLQKIERRWDDQSQCLEDLSTTRVLYDGSPEDWVLANSTTAEYVRFDAIVEMQDCRDLVTKGPFMDHQYYTFGLGHVILSRICWSSDESVAMDTEGLSYQLHRGPWAGHRFTIGRKELLGEEGWTDISDQVVKDMEILAKGFYGSGWRERVKKMKYQYTSEYLNQDHYSLW